MKTKVIAMRLRARERAVWNRTHAPKIVRKKKHCPRCDRTRLVKFFHLALHSPDSLRPWCVDCNSQYQKHYYFVNREERRKYRPPSVTGQPRQRKFLTPAARARVRTRLEKAAA